MADNHDDRDHLDTWLQDRIEPLSPPPGTFEAIQHRARRRKLRKLAVSAGAAAAIIAAVVTVPQVVKMPVEPERPEAGVSIASSPQEWGTQHGTVTPGTADGNSVAPIPLPSGNPVPPNFQPTSVTAVSAQTMFVIGQAGTPGQCATQYCTSVARTQDEGGSWQGLPAPLTGAPDGASGVGQIRFLEGINGWAFGPELWATHNGGETWTRISTHGQRVIDVETVGKRAFAIEADCTGTGQAYAAQCTNFTLYSTLATGNDWTPVGASTTNVNKQGAYGSAALVLTGTRGYLLAPNGTLYAGPVTGTAPWKEMGRIPCAVGLATLDGTPAGAVLGALSPQNLILSCQTKAIYQSADGGASWQQIAAGPAAATAGTTSRSPTGTTTGSPTGTATDTPTGASTGTPTGTSTGATTGTPVMTAVTANAIAASQTESVILATSQGIQVLPAGSSSWRAATLNGTAPAAGFSFVGMTTPTRGIALPADPQNGTVWFTTDGGLSWTPSQVQGPN
jgi:hypothetical protein